MSWQLSYCAIMLAFLDMLLVVKVVQKYTPFMAPEAFERFAFNASLEDFFKVRGHIISCLFMLNVAGLTRWLP